MSVQKEPSTSRRGRGSKEKAAEKYRAYNNKRTFDHLETIMDIVRRNISNDSFPYSIDVFARGRELLASRDYAGLDRLVVELKNAELNLSLKVASTSEIAEFEEDIPIAERTSVDVTDCIYLSPSAYQDVCVKVKREGLCDQVLCDQCKPVPDGETIIFEQPLGVCIYAGPGSGKTFALKDVPLEYRGMFVDTDHLCYPYVVPPRSIVLTNRPDVLSAYLGLRISLLPTKAIWLERCRSKCGEKTLDTWYDDVLPHLRGSYLMRSNAWLSELMQFRYVHCPRKRKK